MLPQEPRLGHELPARGAVAARTANGGAGKWLMVLVGLVVIAGAGALGYRQRRAPDRHQARPAQRSTGEGPTAPSGPEPVDPALLRRLAPALQAAGEPPWPAACHGQDAAALRRLAEVAPALAAAPASGLAALRGLPASLPERWVIEARATLAADPAAAVQASEKAVALCPSSAVAHNLLGNALQRTQRLDRAEQEYRAAMKLAPRFLAPVFNVGLIGLRRDDAKGALAAFQAVGAVDADYPNLPLVRADAHRRLGDAAAARADLQDQVSRHPDVAEGWLQLGRARAAAHDQRGARDAFCRAKALGDAAAAPLCHGGR